MQSPRFLDVYKELIATSSISSTDPTLDEGNAKVCEKLANWLCTLGFEVETDEIAPGKVNLMAKKGSGEGGLLMSGHTDTVPFDESRWNYNPHALTEDNQRFYGLGTADMKGFFAFVIEAVKKIDDWAHQQKPLYILATCDEEISMLGARHFSATAPFKPDYCIIGEPTRLTPVYGHKGHVANAIRITGQSGHSSNPAYGINAIEIMQEVLVPLLELRAKLCQTYHHPGFDIPSPTLNLGHIHGGESSNTICGCCELHYDIRPLPGMSLDSLDNLLQEALQEVQAKWPGRIAIIPLHAPIPGYECALDHAFVSDMSQLSQSAPQTVNYCTEAPFLQTICPTLVLGPGSIEQAHQPDEYLAFEFIDPTIEILSKAMRQYCF